MAYPPTATPLTPPTMVHVYRGVMDLACVWCARIDGTTNWAIVTAGSIASFLLSDRGHPPLMALFGMFLTFAFLNSEAYRFRFYDVWAGWVRVLETENFVPALRHNSIDIQAPWQALLQQDLATPHFQISWAEAVGRRLRYSYWAIFAFLLLVWGLKLRLVATTAEGACATMLECAAIGPLPGGVVVLL